MDKKVELFGMKLRQDYLLSAAMCIFALCLIFFVILPQFSEMGEAREKIADQRKQVQDLQTSVSTLQSISDSALQNDSDLASSALPSNKNYISVFSKVTQLAQKENISINGFTVSVGRYYTNKEKGGKDEIINSDLGAPTLKIDLEVEYPSSAAMSDFIDGLYTSFPLTKIQKMTSIDQKSTLEILYFYKPFDLNQIKSDQTTIPNYSVENVSVLQMLKAFQENQSQL